MSLINTFVARFFAPAALAAALMLALVFGLTPSFAFAQRASSPTERDVPRWTQMGDGKAPKDAPGKGRYTPPIPARVDLPTLWLIGDSTVRSGTEGAGVGRNWGWGAPVVAYFDLAKINVVNRAFGGTSSRTFYRDFFWADLRPLIRKGDYVLIQFGANDSNATKGALDGIDADRTETRDGETVHSFGWYLRQYIRQIREAGATPVLCSMTPRKKWSADGKLARDTTHAVWAQQIAVETSVLFVPLNELIARRFDALGTDKVTPLYVPAPKEDLHPGWHGAVLYAECVVAGLRALPADPFAKFLSDRGLKL